MQDTNSIQSNSPRKGLNLDINTSLLSEDTLTHMRNGSLFTHDGDFLFATNEQSNTAVCTLPYPLIGYTKLPDGTWCLFTTDDTDSEIGIFREDNHSYTTILNKPFLNFNRSNLITAVSKENGEDGTYSVYWADGRRNPDRILNLSHAQEATYDSIRLSKLITPPHLSLKKGTAGVLPTGSYQAAIRYSYNNKSFGDTQSVTLPVAIFSEDTLSGSLEVNIDNLDNDFKQFELIIIQERNNTTTAKSIGFYPSKTGIIYIDSFDRPEYRNIELSEIVVQNTVWIASDQLDSNSQNLFRIGTETIPELNYQLQAFDINTEYVVWQADADYHSYGDNVGYYRDEVYAIWIQWLHKTGVWSSLFTVPGREATTRDTGLASGNDVYERLIKTCDEDTPIPVWMVDNTADAVIPVSSDDTICDGKVVGYGNMAYYESKETYPDNPIQFGRFAGKPIRHPRFPNEERCPRYTTTSDGKTHINLLGLRLSNIPHPLKEEGTPDTDWVGYRILRADRRGNKSVISRGLLTNVRSYNEKRGQENVEVMYTNYPINDLSPDQYISQTQTYFKNSREQGFKPLTKVYKDRFSFYSPHSTIGRYALGSELKIESEEVATVDGEFTPVYQHPKQRLLSLFSFWLAAATGATEALLVTLGKNTYVAESELLAQGVVFGPGHRMSKEYKIETVADLIGLDVVSFTKDMILAGNTGAFDVIKNAILALTSVGLKALMFTFFGIKAADDILNVITDFLGNINYTLQYNCHAHFNKSLPVAQGYRRRFVTNYQYIESGLQSISGSLYNNFGKHNSVYIQTNMELSDFKTVDNTRQTLTGFNLQDDITQKTQTTGVGWYATSRVPRFAQYGRIESNTRFILTHNNYFKATPEDRSTTYSTDTIFGGDCYIVRYTHQTKHQFFTQNQANTNAPEGEQFDYKLYRNIGYPRFWADFFRYNFSELIQKDVGDFSNFSNTVTSRHNLDNKGEDDTNSFRVDNAYFYLSNNGVLDFFVESDYNLSYREKPKGNTYFYSKKFSTLSEIFRSDRLLLPEEFNYDTSLNKQADQVYAQQQPINYNPGVYNTKFKYDRNRVIYSLPSFNEHQYDAWTYFLTTNQHTFDTSGFGNLTSIHRVDGDRILFLFSRSSPYISTGQDELQLTDGRTIQIGNGGIFARPPRELMYTEQHYGSSQSRFAAISTQYGSFYVSERQGRFLNFSGKLDDMTRDGIQMWSKQYFPIKLTSLFPDFIDYDNPVKGVGYNISVDSTWDIIYISKKDYYPKEEYVANFTYNRDTNTFYYKDIPVQLEDATYFHNLSFTLSYSPTLKAFVSFHDWVPDMVLPTEKHFITSKGRTLYLHNSNPKHYCNFYGNQYPFEIEYIATNKFSVETLCSLEYYLECYKYRDSRNRAHILNANFDKLIVSNSEQISGLLTLQPSTNNPYQDIIYPIPNNLGFTTLYTKSENKYRVNEFWDITRDRQSENPLILYHPNGYTRIINEGAIDVAKPQHERKYFRHYDTRFFLSKENPDTLNMIFKLSIAKEKKSIR